MTNDEFETEAGSVAERQPRNPFAALKAGLHWFFRRPSRQVITLAGVSLAAVLIIASVSITQISDATSRLHRVSTELDPVVEEVTKTQKLYSGLFSGIIEAVPTIAAGADPAMALGELTPVASSAEQAWTNLKKAALGFPGERALLAEVEAAVEVALENATPLLQGVTAEALAQVQTDFSTLDRALQRVRALYETRSRQAVAEATLGAESAKRGTLVASVAVFGLMITFFALALSAARARQREHDTREIDREILARRSDLETRLQRALEMIHSEDQAYVIVEDVLRRAVEVVPAEVLVADSSHAHVRQVASTDAESRGPGCPVGEPRECPAASRGQTQVFPSSTDIDACPYLRDRAGPPCSAVCVPLSIAGKTVGVIHTTAPDHTDFARETVMSLELVARKTGDRVGMIRAFDRSETQARMDPLTGLLNRRSLEDAVRKLPDGGTYAIAYGDLDHFKMLNDVHGHDAGDRALRAFARVLRDSVRPSDIPARYGGEEFVVVLPDCRTEQAAVDVVERVRERLHAAQDGSPLPSFTVSFGVALSEPGAPFSEVVDAADQALLLAKAGGRDRVVVSGSAHADPDHEPTSEPTPVA